MTDLSVWSIYANIIIILCCSVTFISKKDVFIWKYTNLNFGESGPVHKLIQMV